MTTEKTDIFHPPQIFKIRFNINLKLCASKDTIKKVKRQLREWEKKIANHVSYKGPVSRTYKELLQLSYKNGPKI